MHFRRLLLMVPLVIAPFFTVSCLDSAPPEETEAGAEEVSSEPGPGDPSDSADSAEAPEKKVTYTELRREKKELERQLKDLEEMLEGQEELVKRELEIATELEEIRAYHSRIETLDTQLSGALESWRSATRESFVGVQLPEVTTIEGQTFRSITIRSVGSDTLTFNHDGGEATVDIVSLPVSLRKNLIHEPTILTSQ